MNRLFRILLALAALSMAGGLKVLPPKEVRTDGNTDD